MGGKIKTGSAVLDTLLGGGFEQDVITMLYGPASSGKTCFCFQAALAVAQEKKVMYVDTEGGFSPERLQQLGVTPALLEKIILFSPTNFNDQQKVIAQLATFTNDRMGLIIIDSIAMLYRLEMHKSEDIHQVNRQLALQLAALTEITRKHNVPIVLTNQVYARFDDRGNIQMVGGDLLKYTSKCIIELQKNDIARKAILQKHRALPHAEISFEIKKEGTNITNIK